MISICKSDNELRRMWRQQILAHCNSQFVESRKGFVAVTFVDQANTQSRFVDISNLLAVLVYEDDTHYNNRRSLRLSAYKVSRIADGVRWGGAENSRMHKDLTLAPQYGARGQRLDRIKNELIALALKLDRRLSRAASHPAAPWAALRLPRLWAGFRARQAETLRGKGPEFEQMCHKRCRVASEVFCESAREIANLTAYPLDWISNQLSSAVAVFAEVAPGLRRQVCRNGSLPEGLIGFHGASEFDFFSSRFRGRISNRSTFRGGNCRTSLIEQNATAKDTIAALR